MRILYRTNHLRQCNESMVAAARTWGVFIARRYRRRLQLVADADTFESLFSVQALRLHPLRGDRAGLYAVDLDHQWRLILSVQDNVVVVEEVSNHYDG